MIFPFKLTSILGLVNENTNRGKMIRFLVFVFLYYICRNLLMFFETTSIGWSILGPLHGILSSFITHSCCLLLSPFYPDIHTSANFTIFIDGNAYLYMAPGCSGLVPMISLTVALLFYPLPLRKKAILWPVSLFILLLASILHFLLLIPVIYQYPEWFALFHKWLTRIFFYGFYFLCWVLWERVKWRCLK